MLERCFGARKIVVTRLQPCELCSNLVTLAGEHADSPEEFGAFIRAEISRWAKVVQLSGAKAD